MPGWTAMPPAADPPPGERLALVVATSTYTDPGLRRLRAPARDAADLAQVLADPDIGEIDTVITVIDQPAQQVRLAVEDFLDGRGTGDLLLVYLVRHGLLDDPPPTVLRRRRYPQGPARSYRSRVGLGDGPAGALPGPPPGAHPGFLLQRRVRPRGQGPG